jgi:hypothetical protein
MKMSRRVFVGRVVAAADMAAGPTQPQMQPNAAGLEAFLAAERARRDITDAGDMRAVFGHAGLLLVERFSLKLTLI